jgi:hypothetical protein
MTIKVLLLGEFSGFYAHLAAGLRSLGHEVTIAAGYDGYKSIRPDIALERQETGRLSQLSSYVLPWAKLRKLSGFDVVQVVHPFTPNLRFFPNYHFLQIVKRSNGKLFMSAAGSDPVYWQIARSRLPYGPFDDYLQYDLQKKQHKFQTGPYLETNKKIAQLCDGIIPIMYDYFVGYRDFENLKELIPLPVDKDKIAYQPPDYSKGPLKVFHGLTRYGFKGTRFVQEAFDRVSNKYPNDIECRIEGKLPLQDYLKLMATQQVIIDQVNSFSTGMNGLFSMAGGKVTLGGSEPIANQANYGEESPIVNVLPETSQIISKLEMILDRRAELTTMAEEGRRFVETHHCCRKVAQRYLDVWAS